MLRWSLIILCISTTIGQRKGTRYVRLPSGYTYAEPTSSNRLSKLTGANKYGFSKAHDARYQISPSLTQSLSVNHAYNPAPPPAPPPPHKTSVVQTISAAPKYVEVLPGASTLISSAGEGLHIGAGEGTHVGAGEGTHIGGGEGTHIGGGEGTHAGGVEGTHAGGGEGTFAGINEGTRAEAGEGTAVGAGEGTAVGGVEGTLAGEGTAAEAAEGTAVGAGGGTAPAGGYAMKLTKADTSRFITNLHTKNGQRPEVDRRKNIGHTFTSLGGGQFYQSLLGGKNGFSPLSFFLQNGRNNAASPFLIPVPIVVPPPPPPPPGPKCYTNPSGFLCCNVTLERTMEMAYLEAKSEGISLCNVQKMATAVQEAAEKKFAMSFESIVGHKDFVAKVNFAGDLNCKIEVDGKFFLAYATPNQGEEEVNIIDANSFFSGDAEELLESHNGTDGKPTYIVYGPIR